MMRGATAKPTRPMAQALYEEGLRLAKQLGEPWWAMYYAQRRIQARMFWGDHFDDALAWAVESALEARKPQYASFPELFTVYFNLLLAYIGVDPAGYAAEIRQAIRSLEQDVPRIPARRLPAGVREAAVCARAGRPGRGSSSPRSVRCALAEEGVNRRSAAYHLSFVYEDLCGIDFKRGDLELLARTRRIGRGDGPASPANNCRWPEFQLWQALLARRSGDETQALSLRRTGDRSHEPPETPANVQLVQRAVRLVPA